MRPSDRIFMSKPTATAESRSKVFRVYAYMILPGGDTVDDSRIVISDPYYMTMFDYATKYMVIERE